MWITLAPADFAGRLTVNEIATIARNNAQGDNSAAILVEVSGEVRGYVAGLNPLGPVGTVPDECKNAAMAIATERFINQFPDSGLLTPSREKAAESARDLLKQVALGRFKIVPPDLGAPVQPDTPLPAVSRERRRFGAREERGL